MAKKSGGLIGFIKGLVIFAVVVFGLAVAVYVGVKATTGIDILKVGSQVKALQNTPSEEEVVPNKYTDNDIVTTLDSMFGDGSGNTIYKTNEDGNREFSHEEYQTAALNASVTLSGKQIAGLANSLLHSLDQNAFVLKNSDVEILSMEFSNLQSDGTFDCKVIAKVDFKATKDDISKNGNFLTKIIKNYLPDTLYVTTNFTAKYTANNKFEYVESKEVTLNNMKAEDTSEINKIITKFLGEQDLVGTINKNITTILFGGTEENEKGLLTCFANADTSISLVENEVKIVITLN